MEEVETLNIGDLDKLIQELQEKGAYAECLSLHDECIKIRSRIYGENSKEVATEKLDVAHLYNTLSLQLLYLPSEREDFIRNAETIKKYLKMAEILTEPHPASDLQRRLDIRATTFNNMACLFRKEGKLRAALQCAHKALKIQKKADMKEAMTASLLNICALNSAVGKHELALSTAETALDTVLTLEEERFNFELALLNVEKEEATKAQAQSSSTSSSSSSSSSASFASGNLHTTTEDRVNLEAEVQVSSSSHTASCDTARSSRRSVPCIRQKDKIYYAPLQVMCYINIGTELEHLQRWRQCLEAYQTAYQLSYLTMGAEHALTIRCSDSFADVFKKSSHTVEGDAGVLKLSKSRKPACSLPPKVPKVLITPEDTLHSLALAHQKHIRQRNQLNLERRKNSGASGEGGTKKSQKCKLLVPKKK